MSNKLAELFDKADGEFLKFERIENPRHPRPDMCAFLILHDLVPSNRDMVAAAEHDEIYLDIDCEKLTEVADEAIIIDLHRCGIRYCEEYNSLCMFV